MKKYQIIGCMTGNSMDAVDLVLTEFEGEKMKDIIVMCPTVFAAAFDQRFSSVAEKLLQIHLISSVELFF